MTGLTLGGLTRALRRGRKCIDKDYYLFISEHRRADFAHKCTLHHYVEIDCHILN